MLAMAEPSWLASRPASLHRRDVLTGQIMDIAIIGGGINGCGIARDAAGRGVVVLFEQDDLASGTSSASTKLIHGGLRYLEHYEFRLVREALMEREVLWRLRRTSSGRCASYCRTTTACARPGCCGSACSSMTISAAASCCRPTRSLDLATRSGGRAAEAALYPRLRIFRLLGRRFAPGRAQRARCGRARGATIRTRTRVVGAARENGVGS